jgi:hypothetical protein
MDVVTECLLAAYIMGGLYEYRLSMSTVRAEYGWKSDLSDEQILEKLRALNLESGKLNEQIL